MKRAFRGREPRIATSAFVEDSAQLVGDVWLGPEASVWFGAVLRGDINRIEIGARSNIQDGAVLHVTRDHPVVVGEDVTVGHRAVVHGATIGARVMIGIAAVVLDGAKVGEGSVIAAGALVAPGTEVPPASLVMGLPGRVVRELDAAEQERALQPARNYVGYAAEYRREYGRP